MGVIYGRNFRGCNSSPMKSVLHDLYPSRSFIFRVKIAFLHSLYGLPFVIFAVQPFSELKLRVNCHHFFVFLFQSLCPFPAEVIRQELQKFPGAKGIVFLIASPADILRGASRVPASRVPAPRGAGTRDTPVRMSAGEAIFLTSTFRNVGHVLQRLYVFPLLVVSHAAVFVSARKAPPKESLLGRSVA